MKKEIIYDLLADKELQDFEMEVKKDFVASIKNIHLAHNRLRKYVS